MPTSPAAEHTPRVTHRAALPRRRSKRAAAERTSRARSAARALLRVRGEGERRFRSLDVGGTQALRLLLCTIRERNRVKERIASAVHEGTHERRDVARSGVPGAPGASSASPTEAQT